MLPAPFARLVFAMPPIAAGSPTRPRWKAKPFPALAPSGRAAASQNEEGRALQALLRGERRDSNPRPPDHNPEAIAFASIENAAVCGRGPRACAAHVRSDSKTGPEGLPATAPISGLTHL